MVAGDHNRLDSGFPADGNGFLGFRTRRVNHADQTHEGKACFQLIRGGICGNLVDFLVCNGKNTEGICTHAFGHTLCGIHISGNAPGHHHIKCPLDDDDVFTVNAVDGGHQLTVGIKGDFRKSRRLLVQLILGHSVFMRREDDGSFGGVTNVLFFCAIEDHGTVTAEGGIGEELFDLFGIVCADVFGSIFTVRISLGQCHAVLGEGAGLVRADDGRTAESFHGRQTADERIFLDHTLYTDGKYDGNDGRQTFGNGGNGERYGGHEDFQYRNAVCKTDDKDNRAGGKGYDAEVFAELCQLLLQGCLTVFFVVKQICDFAHFGIHTGCGDNGGGGTVGDGTAGEDHIVTVAQRCLFVADFLRILFGGYGFTGQRGFFAIQADGTEKSGIGGNEIAGFQSNDVAGNKLRCVDDGFHTVTDDSGVGS